MIKLATLLGQNKDSARAVAVDSYDAMSDEERQFLDETARLLIDAYNAGGHDMKQYFAAQRLDSEEQLAIWSRLPSHIRRAIKAGT